VQIITLMRLCAQVAHVDHCLNDCLVRNYADKGGQGGKCAVLLQVAYEFMILQMCVCNKLAE
jgi:hypothetical protein